MSGITPPFSHPYRPHPYGDAMSDDKPFQRNEAQEHAMDVVGQRTRVRKLEDAIAEAIHILAPPDGQPTKPEALIPLVQALDDNTETSASRIRELEAEVERLRETLEKIQEKVHHSNKEYAVSQINYLAHDALDRAEADSDDR